LERNKNGGGARSPETDRSACARTQVGVLFERN